MQSKAWFSKLSLPRGVTLGLRIGDLASFSMAWLSLGDTEPLQVRAVIHNETILSSQEEFKAGAIPYHKISSLQIVVRIGGYRENQLSRQAGFGVDPQAWTQTVNQCRHEMNSDF